MAFPELSRYYQAEAISRFFRKSQLGLLIVLQQQTTVLDHRKQRGVCFQSKPVTGSFYALIF